VKIRIGVGFGGGHMLDDPAAFGRVVDIVEDLAFDSIWMSDRVVGAAIDPLAALAFAAGRTTNLKLGTNVLVLPGRDPFAVAKQMAAIDRLSEGRLLPAFGLGSPSRADRPPFGVPRGTRAALFEEDLAIVRQLWSGEPVPHPDPGGKPYLLSPGPTKPLEVWFGGKSPKALERTGRLSDGWIGSFQRPAETGAARRTIEAAAAAAGRAIDDDHYGVSIFYARHERSELAELVVRTLADDYVPDEVLPLGEHELQTVIAAHVAEGLTKFVLVPSDAPDDMADELNWLREVTRDLET
jgi:probable F420-dependent oxidoreductase